MTYEEMLRKFADLYTEVSCDDTFLTSDEFKIVNKKMDLLFDLILEKMSKDE